MSEERALAAATDGVKELLRALEDGNAKYQMEIAPSVHAFGATRAMGRIRSYSSAGLSPFAGRGMPNEFMLMGHVHVDAKGRVTRVEGFNGPEGERWAKQAHDKLKTMEGALAPDAVLQALTPLRHCPHTGIR